MDAIAPLDSENAREALLAACVSVGIDATDAELIRLGENAVFRLKTIPIVVRVSRTTRQYPEAMRELAVSRWLENAQVPVVQALDIAQPIIACGRTIVLWHSAADSEEYGTTKELAAILHKLHGLTPPAHLILPPLRPLERAWQRIGVVQNLDKSTRQFLGSRCTDLQAAYDGLSFELPIGPVHDDANVGNLIRGRDGKALLSDLGGFAIGPREWDLVLTALYYERYGWHTRKEYDEFTEIYGYDIMTWPGYSILADIRELLMITWLAQNARPGTKESTELARRIRDVKSNTSRQGWIPF